MNCLGGFSSGIFIYYGADPMNAALFLTNFIDKETP